MLSVVSTGFLVCSRLLQSFVSLVTLVLPAFFRPRKWHHSGRTFTARHTHDNCDLRLFVHYSSISPVQAATARSAIQLGVNKYRIFVVIRGVLSWLRITKNLEVFLWQKKGFLSWSFCMCFCLSCPALCWVRTVVRGAYIILGIGRMSHYSTHATLQ